jgi:hypothetical protein
MLLVEFNSGSLSAGVLGGGHLGAQHTLWVRGSASGQLQVEGPFFQGNLGRCQRRAGACEHRLPAAPASPPLI